MFKRGKDGCTIFHNCSSGKYRHFVLSKSGQHKLSFNSPWDSKPQSNKVSVCSEFWMKPHLHQTFLLPELFLVYIQLVTLCHLNMSTFACFCQYHMSLLWKAVLAEDMMHTVGRNQRFPVADMVISLEGIYNGVLQAKWWQLKSSIIQRGLFI